jgi:hypothetical protein
MTNNNSKSTKSTKSINSTISQGEATMNTTEINVETKSQLNPETGGISMFNGHAIRFIDSKSYPGAIGAVIFTPANHNGLFLERESSLSAKSDMNVIREFLNESYLKAGEFVHVFGSKNDRYDGMKTFYLGGNIVVEAILSGHRSIRVQVAEKMMSVSLPADTDLLGEWVVCRTITDYTARVIKADDEQHAGNIVAKHFIMDKLLNGTKLSINTTPCIARGEPNRDGSEAAKLLRSEMFEADGLTQKSTVDMMHGYYSRKQEYAGNNKLNHQAKTMAKAAPVIGLSIMSVLKVNNVEANIADVEEGRYRVIDQYGMVKAAVIHVDKSLSSENRLKVIATSGWSLVELPSIR